MKIENAIESPKKFDVEELIEFLAKELEINEDVKLMIVYNDNLLDRLSKSDVEYEAFLQQALNHTYVLHIREDVSGLQYILCHEMVHLHQYERGDLKISSDYRVITGKDEDYDNTCPYNDREGEKEAFKLQNKLGKAFKKSK